MKVERLIRFLEEYAGKDVLVYVDDKGWIIRVNEYDFDLKQFKEQVSER